MSVDLNHTIVHAHNQSESAAFFVEILGLAPPETFDRFTVVRTGNGVSLDFLSTEERIDPQHYAFLVSEPEFDAIFARIQARGLPFWADPGRQAPNQINTHYGGRGVYFADPAGHSLEVLTVPYGGWPQAGD